MRFAMPLPLTDTNAYLHGVRNALLKHGWLASEQTGKRLIMHPGHRGFEAGGASLKYRGHQRIVIEVAHDEVVYEIRRAVLVRHLKWLAAALATGVQVLVLVKFGLLSPQFWIAALSGAAFAGISSFIVNQEVERFANELVYLVHHEVLEGMSTQMCV